jgi:hypothetical protein
MSLKYFLLILLIVIISFILLREKEDFLTPAIFEIQMEENQEKYNKFQKIQEKILAETQFQIGYEEDANTNASTIGICPLGKFFKGEVPENISAGDITKCHPCTPCNKGYYLKGGCSGNTDSICEAEKVPHSIFVRAHGENKLIHNLINPHQHPYDFKGEPNVGQTFKLSDITHTHL